MMTPLHDSFFYPVLNGFNNILPGFKDEDMDQKLYQKSMQSIYISLNNVSVMEKEILIDLSGVF